ncbi:hypothetical protein M0R45_004663 [Rubus argutus]|uniref:Isopenicillin N synthase-like Fe(2+) 2OG dioxygenase domain-containing protein n=1 Tax=Rubus argutus TaxID=59490 RepID=A0AAW1YKI0_RUBAR
MIPIHHGATHNLQSATSPAKVQRQTVKGNNPIIWLSVLRQVCNALEDQFGCFTATLSNKITLELHNTVFGAVNELFEKWPFCGHFKTNSVHEGLGIYDPTNPEEIHKFSYLFWPDGNHQFCDGVHLYAKVMKELDQAVTRMVNGLEIYTKYGEWIGFDPHPLPSSFIFIATDVFQVWSNDRIRSCKHRVNLSHSDEVRYSFGLFSLKNGVTTIPDLGACGRGSLFKAKAVGSG